MTERTKVFISIADIVCGAYERLFCFADISVKNTVSFKEEQFYVKRRGS